MTPVVVRDEFFIILVVGSEAAKQRSSEAAKQRSSEAAKQHG
jgi:hypothetical protein